MGLPDNASATLFDAVEADPTIQLVTVTREGEAFAIASGLWVGGARPFVTIQNTGLLESGDAVRGTALRMSVPLPFLVTYRGFAKMKTAAIHPLDEPIAYEWMVRPDVDSVSLVTEPTLNAWAIPYKVCGAHDLAATLEWTFQEVNRLARPMAILLHDSLT